MSSLESLSPSGIEICRMSCNCADVENDECRECLEACASRLGAGCTSTFIWPVALGLAAGIAVLILMLTHW